MSSPTGKPLLGLFCLIAIGMIIIVALASCSSNKSAAPQKRHIAVTARHAQKEAQRPEPRSAEEQKKPEEAAATKPAEEQQQPTAEPGTETKPAAGENSAKVTTTEVTPGNEAAPGEQQKPVTHRASRPAETKGEISHVNGGNRIALTFDAGASPAPTPDILRALREQGIHATFFLTGKWCEQNPTLVKQIAEEGHEIGNHTYSHPDLRKLSDNAIIEQLQKTEDLVLHLTGHSTKPLFRPPFGARNKHVLSVVGQEGYTSIYWAVDSWDAFKKGITSEEIKDRVLDKVQGGDIVLMHCGSQPTADALPEIINQLQHRGFQIVRVSDLIGGQH